MKTNSVDQRRRKAPLGQQSCGQRRVVEPDRLDFQRAKVFASFGHLGDFNDLSLAGTLSGVEMGLALSGVPHQAGGVAAALAYLTEVAREAGGAKSNASAA